MVKMSVMHLKDFKFKLVQLEFELVAVWFTDVTHTHTRSLLSINSLFSASLVSVHRNVHNSDFSCGTFNADHLHIHGYSTNRNVWPVVSSPGADCHSSWHHYLCITYIPSYQLYEGIYGISVVELYTHLK